MTLRAHEFIRRFLMHVLACAGDGIARFTTADRTQESLPRRGATHIRTGP
jgi:hypothetical protein